MQLEETKQNLDAVRKENAENVLKIGELLKENLRLINEINNSYNHTQEEQIKNDVDIRCKESINISSFIEQPNDINQKLQDILLKCNPLT